MITTIEGGITAPAGFRAAGVHCGIKANPEKLDLAPATLSFHLAGLTRAGLAQSRQEGRFVIYSADFQAMNTLVAYLSENCCGGRECSPRAA